MVQAGGSCVIVWGMLSWLSLGLLTPINHRLNATAYFCIAADHVHSSKATIALLPDVCLEHDNAPSHKAKVV